MVWWHATFGMLMSLGLFFLGVLFVAQVGWTVRGVLYGFGAIVIMATAISTFGKSFQA